MLVCMDTWLGLTSLRKLCVYEASSLPGVCLSLNSISESRHDPATGNTVMGRSHLHCDLARCPHGGILGRQSAPRGRTLLAWLPC